MNNNIFIKNTFMVLVIRLFAQIDPFLGHGGGSEKCTAEILPQTGKQCSVSQCGNSTGVRERPNFQRCTQNQRC